MATRYETLCRTPAQITVVIKPREVIFLTVSVMCDNIGKLTLKKNKDGDFKLSGNGFCLSNWQIKGDDYKTDIEWAADDGKWNTVCKIINTGTSRIESVRSR